MEWPKPETVTKGVTTLNDADTHSQHLERLKQSNNTLSEPPLELGELIVQYSEKGGWTYSRAIQQAMADIRYLKEKNAKEVLLDADKIKDLVVYGAGTIATDIIKKTNFFKKIKNFDLIDSDLKKVGNTIANKKIKSPERSSN